MTVPQSLSGSAGVWLVDASLSQAFFTEGQNIWKKTSILNKLLEKWRV